MKRNEIITKFLENGARFIFLRFILFRQINKCLLQFEFYDTNICQMKREH